MSEAPAPKTTRRRRGADDSDEEENVSVPQSATEAATAAALAAPISDVADADGEATTRRRRAAPKASQFTAAAEAIAAGGAPPSAGVPATAPPSSAAAAPPPASSAAVGAPPIAVASAHHRHHADPTTSAMDLFDMDFEAFTFADLKARCLEVFTRLQVENAMAMHAQAEEERRQENKRVEKFLDVSAAPVVAAAAASPTAAARGDESDESDHMEGYTYSVMLTRLYEQLNRNHEGSAVMERNQVPVPILEKIGKKKTVISNFGRICDAFHRPVEDVKDFIEKELAIRGNLDSNNALILKYQTNKATDFDRIIIKYLDEYVKCNSCHRIDTTLTKDGRRLELRCSWCTATRTVAGAGTATFTAQIEKRSKVRAALTL